MHGNDCDAIVWYSICVAIVVYVLCRYEASFLSTVIVSAPVNGCVLEWLSAVGLGAACTHCTPGVHSVTQPV